VKRKSVAQSQCPIARSVERVGDWWSILILRDALRGLTRFDQFRESLGIAANMLTRRLTHLVSARLLERRLYNEHPPRHEYVLTESGRDFQPVILSLLAWGNRHFAPEGASLVIVDSKTGVPADPVLVDWGSGRPLTDSGFRMAAGPAAKASLRRRYERPSSSVKALSPAQKLRRG
jgi:DNA-binding HxlR family transcriptional regulator